MLGFIVLNKIKALKFRSSILIFILALVLIEIPILFQYFNLSYIPNVIDKNVRLGRFPLGVQYLYVIFSKFFFLTGCVIILLLCMTNKLQWLRTMLGSYIWGPIQELSYSAYLIHYLIIMWYYNSSR